MVVVAVALFAADPVSVVFSVEPKMHCQNCEKKIKSNLRFEKGVKDIATSLDAQTVTVKFDPAKTSKEKIVKAFGQIGYKAAEVTGQKTSCAKAKSACGGQNGCCDSKKEKKAPCHNQGK